MNAFNNTAAPYPREATLHGLFEQAAARFPHRRAVLFGDAALTYEALNQKANRLAHYLRRHGARPDMVIGIVTERSFEMIIGLYGILKSGAAYLPLSATDPLLRVQSILDDAGPGMLLVQKKLYERYAQLHEHVCCIEDLADSDELPGDNLPAAGNSSNLAYVIYTSGSTGMPKGVMIEHHAVVNRLVWMQRDYPISPDDVILQKTPYTFDVSVWELFWWALEGAAVCMPPQNSEKNPLALVKIVQQDHVSVMHFVPSMLNIFLECTKDAGSLGALQTLRLVFTSGEALQSSHVRKFNQGLRANSTRLINLYGPTEATVDVTHYECPADDVPGDIPIGKPISNTRMYILKDGEQQPTGATGELCIAGAGVARGYLNRPALTTEKFIGHGGERLYRTGDLAAWAADGNIRYYGRMDDQVKIRGIRIELGEIEGVLNEYPGIESCVIDIQRPSENVVLLIAYYVAAAALPADDMKQFLKNRLPEYMIPGFFRRLDMMPLTAHGKLNRQALAAITTK